MAKKGLIIGLTIGGIATAAVVGVVGFACWTLFGKPAVNNVYTEQDTAAVVQQLPVLQSMDEMYSQYLQSSLIPGEILSADEAGKIDITKVEVKFTAPTEAECTYSAAELNALFATTKLQINQLAIGSVKSGKFIDTVGAEIATDNILYIRVKFGDCTNASNVEVINSYLTNAVCTVGLKAVEGRFRVVSISINNLDSSMLPQSLLSAIPDFPQNANIIDLINEDSDGRLDELVGYLLLADKINYVNITDGKLIVNGNFYTECEITDRQ